MAKPIAAENKIIIIKNQEEEKTESGLIITGEEDHNKPAVGTVVSVGKRINSNNIEFDVDLKEGEQVVFPRYAGSEIEVERETYIVLSINDVLAKII